jgi:hypothetical protein
MVSFYALLVGSIALDYATGKSRDFIKGKIYILIMRIPGAVLVIFTLYFLSQGIYLLIN